MIWLLKNYDRTYVSKVLNFGEVKANNFGRPENSVAVHPHAAHGIFDHMNNHHFDYYGGSA